MTETELDLARRLAAHPKWRWMRGVWIVDPDYEGDDGLCVLCDAGRYIHCLGSIFEHKPTKKVPDLANPATLGCLWAMLVEASVYGRGASG
jgi:hypothetical protein